MSPALRTKLGIGCRRMASPRGALDRESEAAICDGAAKVLVSGAAVVWLRTRDRT